MNSLRAQLATQLARYDDDAYAALANKGLLRRALKDLEKAPVTEADVQALPAGAAPNAVPALLIRTGGQEVRLDARGPAQAVCSCPASGVCQHILAASIGLQRLGVAEAASRSSSGPDGEAVGDPAAAAPRSPSSAEDIDASGGSLSSAEGASPSDATLERTVDTAPTSTSTSITPATTHERSVDGAPADAEAVLEQLRQSLVALPADALVAHAGKPGYRWAWQFVQDLSLERDFRVEGDRYLVLAFARPRVAFRYMGGGLDSLILDQDLPQPNKYRVAAVLALRLALGLSLVAPEPPKRRGPRTAALDLGLDHALPPEGATAMEDSRTRLLMAARQLFGECVQLGLSHLSRGVQERLSTLAVWAQGADCHRLSRLLRRLADHVELLLARAGGADEHRLMDELALGHALVEALTRALAAGQQPIALLGRARTRYEEAGTLTLLGLGATPWVSSAGYAGLTMIFWSEQERGFLSCTDARPTSMKSFDPVVRYGASGPWRGLSSPSQATGRRLVVTGAQLNDQGRLSAADSTFAHVDEPSRVSVGESGTGASVGLQAGVNGHATVSAVGGADRADGPTTSTLEALLAQLPVDDDWSVVSRRHQAEQRSLLAEPRPMADWVVLRPARTERAVFLPDRQAQVWPLFDQQDRRLEAELFYNPRTAVAMDRIERLDTLPPGTLLVGRLRPGAAGLVIEPLSLITPSPGANGRRVDALHFPPATTAPSVETSSASASASASANGATPSNAETGKTRPPPDGARAIPVRPRQSPVPTVLRELRAWLCRQAERGVPVDQSARWRAEATAWAQRAADDGFHLFERSLRGDVEVAVLMLRWHYLLMQSERLAGGTGEDDWEDRSEAERDGAA